MSEEGPSLPSRRGRVLCVTGVSGGGKGTVCHAIRERHPEVASSISVTTRAPRPGEIDGVDYLFVSDAEFDRLIETGGLIEWVPIYGHRSGTPRGPIDDHLDAGRDVLVECDVTGAEFVARSFPDARIVFLRAPTLTVQRQRLHARGTTGADLERRMAEAHDEIARGERIAQTVVNDTLEAAISDVEAILFGPCS